MNEYLHQNLTDQDAVGSSTVTVEVPADPVCHFLVTLEADITTTPSGVVRPDSVLDLLTNIRISWNNITLVEGSGADLLFLALALARGMPIPYPILNVGDARTWVTVPISDIVELKDRAETLFKK